MLDTEIPWGMDPIITCRLQRALPGSAKLQPESISSSRLASIAILKGWVEIRHLDFQTFSPLRRFFCSIPSRAWYRYLLCFRRPSRAKRSIYCAFEGSAEQSTVFTVLSKAQRSKVLYLLCFRRLNRAKCGIHCIFEGGVVFLYLSQQKLFCLAWCFHFLHNIAVIIIEICFGWVAKVVHCISLWAPDMC